MEEPQIHITPYTVAMCLATVVAILASPIASPVVPPNLQPWFSLFNVIIPALIAVLFVTKTPLAHRAAVWMRGHNLWLNGRKTAKK